MSKLGEVIQSETTRFVAQSYKLHEGPSLGSLVQTRDGDTLIFGIVAGAETAGIDPGRRPIARGQHEESDEAVFAANPQLSKLLVTTFTSIVVGHLIGDYTHCYLPPRPARVHAFVNSCDDSQAREFGSRVDFLDLLLGAERDFYVDEVIASSLRSLAVMQPDRTAFLVNAGKHLASRLGDQLPRLNAILGRIS